MHYYIDTLERRTRLSAQSNSKRVSPTKRDLRWFAALAEHGPLPSSFLLAFGGNDHRSEKRARERLTDLFHEDNTPDGGAYLTRPPQQFRTIDSRYNQLVYDLAPAGSRTLDRSQIKRAAPSGPWLHRFMTSCITASVELATMVREDVSYIPQSAILLAPKPTFGILSPSPTKKASIAKEFRVLGVVRPSKRGGRVTCTMRLDGRTICEFISSTPTARRAHLGRTPAGPTNQAWIVRLLPEVRAAAVADKGFDGAAAAAPE